tara:strand:- start:1403 stop:1537 length:135 start_codon:yes stop_codon:yes gene_type:complete
VKERIKKRLQRIIIDIVAVKEIIKTGYEMYKQERERRFKKEEEK